MQALLDRAFIDNGSGLSRAAIFVMDEGSKAKAVVMRVEEESKSIAKVGYFKLLALSKQTACALWGGIHGVSADNAQKVFERLQAAVLTEPGIDRLVLYRAPEEMVSSMIVNLRKHGWRFLGKKQVHKMAIRESSEATVAHLKKKRRYNIRRQLSKLLENSDSRVRIFVTQNAVDEFLELMMPVQLKTYQNEIGVTISNSLARKEILRSEPARGGPLCFTLEINGQMVAFRVGSVRNQAYIPEELGFDREFENSSPGMSLLFASCDELTKRGLTELDFGEGDAQYKSVLAPEEKDEYALISFGSRLCPRLDSVILTIAKTTEVLLRSLVSSSITARLRRAWRNALARRGGASEGSAKDVAC